MKRGNKFHAKKAACQHGHTHDSRKEARVCDDYHILQRAGHISGLEVQAQYWFTINGVQIKHANGRRVGAKWDFRFTQDGKTVCADAKGVRTEAYVLRAAIFRALYPEIELREV
ncbi:MAG TPA: DUF1064 domain-containing protein [Candidatus Defluviicoccus seviourii]|nr:DUF1064 domain-containing protein [Candidatus Defluviicoccus seviourii]